MRARIREKLEANIKKKLSGASFLAWMARNFVRRSGDRRRVARVDAAALQLALRSIFCRVHEMDADVFVVPRKPGSVLNSLHLIDKKRISLASFKITSKLIVIVKQIAGLRRMKDTYQKGH